MKTNISIKISGVESDDYYARDGRLACNYVYFASKYDEDEVINRADLTYGNVFSTQRETNPMLIQYSQDSARKIGQDGGLYCLLEGGNSYSFYRREYEVYEQSYYDPASGKMLKNTEVYKGQWQPVAINIDQTSLRDFNITAGRSYQYILYPNYTSQKQQFAIVDGSDIPLDESYRRGDIFRTNWGEWSLTELIPIPNEENIPIIKKSYKADINNIWLFKFGLETGAQTQNLSKNEINTLGAYSKVGYGVKNYISGDVSCYLGSEIVPYNSEGYIERLRGAIRQPLSTNERIKMLNQWRSIAYSKNPKLLKDMKGQSWIVQIFSNSNTPHTNYHNQPDKISFSWKQIESVDNCIIYGEGDSIPSPGGCTSIWERKNNL